MGFNSGFEGLMPYQGSNGHMIVPHCYVCFTYIAFFCLSQIKFYEHNLPWILTTNFHLSCTAVDKNVPPCVMIRQLVVNPKRNDKG